MPYVENEMQMFEHIDITRKIVMLMMTQSHEKSRFTSWNTVNYVGHLMKPVTLWFEKYMTDSYD